MVPKLNACLVTILTIFAANLLSGAQFCASDGSDDPIITDPRYMCNENNFSQLSYPPKDFNTSDEYPLHFCDMVFLLDLDQTLTSEENYSQVIQFISDSMTTCMNRGIGYKIFAWPMFNDDNSTHETVCCGQAMCYESFGFMNYRTYVGNYDSFEPVQPVTSQFNFSYILIDDMKRIGKPSAACLYNNYVLITNRLFNLTDESVIKELYIIEKVGCITFTIIAVGNNQIDSKMMFDAYQKVTLNTYVVPSFNCLDNLKECIKPCGTRASEDCYNQELADCPFPTTTEQPSTVTVVTTPKPTPSASFLDDWKIIYLFAISNRTSEKQFNNLVNYISDPLKACEAQKMTIRFLARNDSDSDWITDMSKAGPYLKMLKYDEVLINAADNQFLTGSDNVTLHLVLRALDIPVQNSEDTNVRVPRITLLTDFVSQIFIEQFNKTLLPLLEIYDFNIIAFTQEAYEGYKSQMKIKSSQITDDAGYGDSKELRLCPPSSNVTTIMFIIIGTCSGAMLLLILLTVLYRQKYMWLRKLKRFKTSHVSDPDMNDMVDYWELSWDKLVIKNEHLGNGAYGRVFKGKMIGVPPVIERLNGQETMDYTDCDVAVKMLKHTSAPAKQEFKHEIELMKNLGFNEHIVNMLGCITTHVRCCLVLEYCANRDLLKYVIKKNAELDQLRSSDELNNANREFLNFAWQISQGMRFLVEKGIIHRDLAARNVLITDFAGMKSAKVSDFGLSISKDAIENGELSGGSDRLPIKWLALECLERREFSHKSDVWSFGIVLFEMYSYGEVPFQDIEPNDLLAHMKSGERPKKPNLATDKVFEIMIACWDEKPMKRPDFDELSTKLAAELELTTEGYGYLELIRTNDNRVLLPPPVEVETKNEEENGNAAKKDPDFRVRSVTFKNRQSQGSVKLGREYSLTTKDDIPRLADSSDKEKDKSQKKGRSYLNLPNILPSLNAINPFSKENDFKKTFKRKKTNQEDPRRGSVPY